MLPTLPCGYGMVPSEENNFTIFGTDTYTNGADGSWKFMNQYTNQFDSQNGHARELWDELYRGIKHL